jgi:osmotically-inducible protein OsmY
VTLSGGVPTYAARETAEKLAMTTEGVKAVNNKITVNYGK